MYICFQIIPIVFLWENITNHTEHSLKNEIYMHYISYLNTEMVEVFRTVPRGKSDQFTLYTDYHGC